MALAIDLEIGDSGLTVGYWRISHIVADFPAGGGATIEVTLDGWLDANARAAGKLSVPGARRFVTVGIEDASDADGMSKAALYAAAKGHSIFEGAADV
jgi:hypothetical protein